MNPIEDQIVISIARRDLGSKENANLSDLLNSNIDWDYVLNTARRHGLLPLLHKHASDAFGDQIPGRYRSALKRESVMNAQSVLFLVGKALELQRLLHQNSIENALFKGPLLAQLAYGEVGLRQAGDIDVLIHREDFTRAKALLESSGYEMYPRLTAAQLSSHLSSHCEIQFVRDDWFTVIDLHWDLSPKTFVFGLSGDQVMSRLKTVTLAGTHIRTFSTEDHILYQAMHGAKHLWYRLEWLASFSELVQALENSSWSGILESTLRARATRIVALGLRLVETVYMLELPEDVLHTLDREGQMKKLAQKICDEMFSRKFIAESTDTNIFNLKIMDRKRDALTSTLRAIFVPTLSDWKALSLPAAMHPLYYALRPMRLTKVYSQSLVRRLIQN